MENYFLTNVNRAISDNRRFVREFKTRQDGGDASGGADGATGDDQAMPARMMGDLNPLTLMMLLWMMQGNARQGHVLPGAGYPASGGAGYPVAGGFYSPVSAPLLPGLPFPPSDAINPAVGYLEKLFQRNTPSPTDDNPNPASVLDEAGVAQVRQDLADGKVKGVDLGQSLKLMLSYAPDRQQDAVSRLITGLTDSGDLNITPFLANNYLKTLPRQRRENLLATMALSGLRMDNGKPNTILIGFLLQNLNAKDKPETRTFLRQLLQDFYDLHGQTLDTPVGQILAQIVALAGLSATDGKLQFEAV